MLVAFRDLKQRPMSFLTFFMVCLTGTYIILSMQFMQFGARQADIQRAESKYHVYLSDLQEEHIEKIKILSYVEDVSVSKFDNKYTASIKLKNNDPYLLKSQCDMIIKDIGLDKTEPYKNNIYYTKYGVQDNWINHEYYTLSTSFFYADVLILLLPFIVITIIGAYISVNLKIKSIINEYAALMTMGIKRGHLMRIVIFEYSLIFFSASIISFVLSIITLKIFSSYTYSNFSESFLRFDGTVRIKEAFITILLVYILFLIIVQGCRRLLKQNIIMMLNKTQHISVTYNQKSNEVFASKMGISAYNCLIFKRKITHVFTDCFKTFILFVLPIFFVAFSSSVYGMREQANVRYDYGVFYNPPYEVTDDVLRTFQKYEHIDRVDTVYTYENGSYGGIYIYCVDGKQEEVKVYVERIAEEYTLLFTDNYHDSIMVKKQSKVFSVFYLFQAFILFVSAISISLSDTSFSYSRRGKEISIIRSLGASKKELYRLYHPDMLAKLLSFLCSIIFSFYVWIKFFGMPYISPLYILIVLLIFAVLYFAGHILLCKHHHTKIVSNSLSEQMKEVV